MDERTKWAGMNETEKKEKEKKQQKHFARY